MSTVNALHHHRIWRSLTTVCPGSRRADIFHTLDFSRSNLYLLVRPFTRSARSSDQFRARLLHRRMKISPFRPPVRETIPRIRLESRSSFSSTTLVRSSNGRRIFRVDSRAEGTSSTTVGTAYETAASEYPAVVLLRRSLLLLSVLFFFFFLPVFFYFRSYFDFVPPLAASIVRRDESASARRRAAPSSVRRAISRVCR